MLPRHAEMKISSLHSADERANKCLETTQDSWISAMQWSSAASSRRSLPILLLGRRDGSVAVLENKWCSDVTEIEFLSRPGGKCGFNVNLILVIIVDQEVHEGC